MPTPRRALLAIALLALPAAIAAVTLPHTFSNTTVADADEVNANFSALTDAVNAIGAGGTVTLAPNAAEPFACDGAHDGAVAATAAYTTCICRPSAGWVSTTDGTTACNWTGLDAYTVLLLHFDGANGSNAIVDTTGRHSATVNGNVQLTTAIAKFGSASAFFDGTGDFLDFGADSDFQFGTGDFTLEFWMQSAAANKPASGNYHSFYSVYSGTNGWWIHTNASGNLLFGNTGSGTPAGTHQLYDGAWHHVALARASGTTRSFIDGVLDKTGTYTTSTDNAEPMKIGELLNWGRHYKGYLDEYRISKGIARYTVDFAPPTHAF